MQRSKTLASCLALLAGYVLFKAISSEWVLAERAVALGGMYHWTALVTLVVGWSVALVRHGWSAGSWAGDVKQLLRPTFTYALLAAVAVYGWNHVWAKESTELRKSIRIAQVEEFTKSDAAFDDYLLTLPLGQRSAMPDRETVRAQAISQLEWMMSGGVTFALSLLMYIFAAALLSAVASLLLHQIWGIRPFQG